MLQFIPPLSALNGVSVRPDFACGSSIQGWEPDLCPIVFVAHRAVGERDDHTQCLEVLSACLQPALDILIMYYLSTRTSSDDPFPEWLYLYGIVYDDSGISVYIHFPRIFSSNSSLDRKWGYVSGKESEDFTTIFKGGRPGLAFISSLLHIQAHTLYVVEQLSRWDGYSTHLRPWIDWVRTL